jgi:hypothetical protein
MVQEKKPSQKNQPKRLIKMVGSKMTCQKSHFGQKNHM